MDEKPHEDDAIRALKAIRARIEGVWDDPNLLSMGALTPDDEVDILFFVRVGLGVAKKRVTG